LLNYFNSRSGYSETAFVKIAYLRASFLTTQSPHIIFLEEYSLKSDNRMYGLLFMTAMAGSGDTAAFNGRFTSCHGCRGAVVVVTSSCHGCSGCYGSSCHGGSCYGSSCHGGSYGITTAIWGASCYGSSCHGYTCHGSSCMGSSCHGCFGSHSMAPMMSTVPSTTTTHYYEGSVVTLPTVGTVKLEADEPEAANIEIDLPEGSKLYVDGQMVSTQNRKLNTPPLQRGKQYYYEMKAEILVAGKVVEESRTVIVKAGETVTERFGKLYMAMK
jgi:uncharacterized protein (TIGR03000 family)